MRDDASRVVAFLRHRAWRRPPASGGTVPRAVLQGLSFQKESHLFSTSALTFSAPYQPPPPPASHAPPRHASLPVRRRHRGGAPSARGTHLLILQQQRPPVLRVPRQLRLPRRALQHDDKTVQPVHYLPFARGPCGCFVSGPGRRVVPVPLWNRRQGQRVLRARHSLGCPRKAEGLHLREHPGREGRVHVLGKVRHAVDVDVDVGYLPFSGASAGQGVRERLRPAGVRERVRLDAGKDAFRTQGPQLRDGETGQSRDPARHQAQDQASARAAGGSNNQGPE